MGLQDESAPDLFQCQRVSGLLLTSFNITVSLEEPGEGVGISNALAKALEILRLVNFDGELEQSNSRAHISHDTHTHTHTHTHTIKSSFQSSRVSQRSLKKTPELNDSWHSHSFKSKLDAVMAAGKARV